MAYNENDFKFKPLSPEELEAIDKDSKPLKPTKEPKDSMQKKAKGGMSSLISQQPNGINRIQRPNMPMRQPSLGPIGALQPNNPSGFGSMLLGQQPGMMQQPALGQNPSLGPIGALQSRLGAPGGLIPQPTPGGLNRNDIMLQGGNIGLNQSPMQYATGGMSVEDYAHAQKNPHARNTYKDGGDIHVTKGHDYIKDLIK